MKIGITIISYVITSSTFSSVVFHQPIYQ